MKSNSTSIKSNILLKYKCTSELQQFIFDKNLYLQDIIRNTMVSIRNNNQLEIFSNNDTLLANSLLTEIYQKTTDINQKIKNTTTQKDFDILIEILQNIIDKLSMIICGFGTKKIEDLLFICFGSEFKELNIENPILYDKYELIKKYVCPIGYKIIKWKQSKKTSNYKDSVVETFCNNKIVEDVQNLEDAKLLECFDTDTTNKTLYQKVYEMRITVPNETLKKTIIIYGIVEDIHIDFFVNKYIDTRREDIVNHAINYSDEEREVINKILSIMNVKDVLIYGNEDIYKKMISVFTEVNIVKKTNLQLTIKKFLDLDAYSQRNMIINLLLNTKDEEIQYICYLLYELITVNSLDTNDQNEQKQIYDTLPHSIKTHFKDIIKCSMKTASDNVQKYEKKTISFEQQIHLLKANDGVKEKAIVKLKEIKGKSDETGIKAKQYLEGLLKIPFGIYREEPVLRKIKEINRDFDVVATHIMKLFPDFAITKKKNYTLIEISKYIHQIDNYIQVNIANHITQNMENKTSKELSNIIKYINTIISLKKEKKIVIKTHKQNQINNLIDYLKNNDIALSIDIFDKFRNEFTPTTMSLQKIMNEITILKNNIKTIEPIIDGMYQVLDDSIYGHKHAKDQIMKIISQWMTGEQSGYCFGFEGSPGIGKTSLAKKGLANCLRNEIGEQRPFAFIALGGSCNGSFLEGHGYTYINSSWGKITDILIQTKCMNPIIYIDELDKVSKTENGREIIGILTHIIDQTQNDIFQDKYFSGIDIDLSKVLFIFSYNDAQQIDKVLLDRIHRIKFDNLSLQDKITIVKKYIIQEINKKMGFENIILLEDDIIEYIIETYTAEPGIRKLKELLFDLYGEINLDILKYATDTDFITPIVITRENLENKYLKKYNKIIDKKIHTKPQLGIINGLWANSMGIGGIIPIQTLFFPSTTFLDFKLTGLQGDVMKESMNVAKTLAWNLTPDEVKIGLISEFEKTKCQGLHVHCPEGGVSKDGPSAGAAITCAIYSIFNKRLIRNDIAITGEINLQGEVTAIGGLDVKIGGGIVAGIKTFIYPKTNNKDYIEWKENNGKNIDNIKFVEVSTIEEVFQHVFV